MPDSKLDRSLPLLLILLVVVAGYGLGPTRLALVGEETCRALHGIEMVDSGDWIIATNQGVPILDRPPLQYWTLALVHRWIHPLDPLTLRLSMVVLLLATSLAIWVYTRRFLSETGAFVAAVAYPTMGHVFDLGRRVETDGQFALLLFVALALWHHGYSSGWPRMRTWALSAGVAALASLTKGLQGPIAFFGTIYLFLLLRRDRKWLLDGSHVVGLALFAGLIAIWQVPFYLQTGWEGTRMTWIDPGAGRLSVSVLDLARHLVKFPLSTLGASLPWSILLFGLFARPFWRLEDRARSAVVFMLIGMAAIFGPVWISVGGKTRYVMPMYPLMAVVCGAVAHRCLAVEATPRLRRFWHRYLRFFGATLASGLLVFLYATIRAPSSDSEWILALAQPWPLMILALAIGGLSVGLLYRRESSDRPRQGLLQAFTLAALVAIVFNGPVLNAVVADTFDVGPQVRAVRHDLPADARLVSFKPLHHKFVYWYEETIPIVDASGFAAQDESEYFAVWYDESKKPELPFEWELITRLVMDPDKTPVEYVVVGRLVRE